MPIETLMPALSPTMTEGSVARWLKKEGDEIRSGDVIAEIETDKATMEYEAIDEGRLGKIIVPEGTQGIKVNQPIAVLLAEGEDASAIIAAAAPSSPPAPPAEPAPQPPPASAPPEPQPRAAAPVAPHPLNGHDAERVFATPLARRMAAQAGLDLATLRGSGPQGRIVKADIDQALTAGRAPVSRVPAAPPATARPAIPAPPAATIVSVSGAPPFTEKPHSQMR